MTEQIPFSIVENLLMKLGSSIFREVGLMSGVRNELGKLEEKLSMIKAVLVDAEEQQQRSHAVAIWVQRLKDVVYDADDLFDDFAAEELWRRTDVQGSFAGRVSDFFSSFIHLAFRFQMGYRIKAIRERLDDIGSDISKFNFIPRVVSSDVPAVRNIRWRETCSVVEKSHKIVGRYEDIIHIIDLLLMQQSSGTSTSAITSTHEENQSNIIAIVGMGGLGKTTLSQLVYNDPVVTARFDLKMWVCVSDNFDVKILVRNVIKSATNRDVEDLELDQLQQLLRKNLGRKRYLLVLDDVWNEDVQKWGQFITLLPIGASGSKVLVTTRSTRVASVMGNDSPYIVEGLKDDESWELFESLAFKRGEEHKYPNLAAIGKEIVKMCKGVPLVIRTLGRVLCYKTQESHWLSIKNNKNLILLGGENGILPVLRLSYDNLPIHLKQCFSYCALFPKDHIIERRELVQLWMAQGYIQPLHENNGCLEDIGDDYFEDLLSRSLFEEAHHEEAVNKGTLSYKMHDLIHDLAQSIVNSEVIIVNDDVKAILTRVRHVSLLKATKEVLEDLMDEPIRTFFMRGQINADYDDDLRDSSILSLRYSRAMKLNSIPRFPTSLAKLSHLRYLDLSHGYFKDLPSGVTRLQHFQTLKLYRCLVLKEWPRNMEKLINLRHLEIDEWNELRYMPGGLGELTQLQTLPFFWVGNERMHNKGSMGGLSELQFLNNLRGKLVIKGLSNATVRGGGGKEEANYYKELAILDCKQYLESLKLVWSGSEVSEEEAEAEGVQVVSVLESLQPHPNLKDLFIRYYKGVRFPNWMMNDGLDLHLPNLVRIEMQNCKRCLVLPPFGQLPSLQYLQLWDLPAAESMKEDCPSLSAMPSFPSLKTLEIYNMPNLKGWGTKGLGTEQTSSYPYLEDLRLGKTSPELCLHLMRVPSSLKSLTISEIQAELSLPEEMPSLKNLQRLMIICCPYLSERFREETGENWRRISHIPKVDIH